jgi:hypothetical protein
VNCSISLPPQPQHEHNLPDDRRRKSISWAAMLSAVAATSPWTITLLEETTISDGMTDVGDSSTRVHAARTYLLTACEYKIDLYA